MPTTVGRAAEQAVSRGHRWENDGADQRDNLDSPSAASRFGFSQPPANSSEVAGSETPR